MTYNETLMIFAVLKANYDNFFKTLSKTDAEAKVNLWYEIFEDDPYELVGAAVKSYIASDTSGYPPNVGTIKEHIRSLADADELSEAEVQNIIKRALSNSGYNADTEFNKLPDEVKILVGSPQQLREWALMDIDELNTVVMSNLMRSYRTVQKRVMRKNALPEKLRNVFKNVDEKLKIERT